MNEPAAQPTAEPSPDTLITPAPAPLDFTAGKPEGFPDDFWDAEKKAPVIDKLFTDWQRKDKIAKDLRVKLGKGEFEGKPPEDIKEYTVELSDELKPLVPEDDRIYNAARQAAKDAGLPKEAFNKFMQPVIAELAKAKAEMETPPTAEEIEAGRMAEVEKLGPSGQKIVEAVGSFIEQLYKGGTLSEAEAKAAKNMVFDADSARVMNKLRVMAGGRDQVPVDAPIDDKASRMDVEKKMAEAMRTGNEADYLKFSSMLAKMNN